MPTAPAARGGGPGPRREAAAPAVSPWSAAHRASRTRTWGPAGRAGRAGRGGPGPRRTGRSRRRRRRRRRAPPGRPGRTARTRSASRSAPTKSWTVTRRRGALGADGEVVGSQGERTVEGGGRPAEGSRTVACDRGALQQQPGEQGQAGRDAEVAVAASMRSIVAWVASSASGMPTGPTAGSGGVVTSRGVGERVLDVRARPGPGGSVADDVGGAGDGRESATTDGGRSERRGGGSRGAVPQLGAVPGSAWGWARRARRGPLGGDGRVGRRDCGRAPGGGATAARGGLRRWGATRGLCVPRPTTVSSD